MAFRIKLRFKAFKPAVVREYREYQTTTFPPPRPYLQQPVPPRPGRLHDGPPVPYPQTWTCPRCGRGRPMVDALYCQDCSNLGTALPASPAERLLAGAWGRIYYGAL